MAKNPRLKPEQRLEIIKRELPRGTTQNDISVLCGVCVDTISRDIKAWELSGGWDDWIRREFKDLFATISETDEPLAFREMSKLATRTMTQRTESKVEGFGTLLIWRPGEDKPGPEEPEPEEEDDEEKT